MKELIALANCHFLKPTAWLGNNHKLTAPYAYYHNRGKLIPDYYRLGNAVKTQKVDGKHKALYGENVPLVTRCEIGTACRWDDQATAFKSYFEPQEDGNLHA